MVVIEITTFCYQAGRQYPINMVLLAIFTICQSYVVSYFCSYYYYQIGGIIIFQVVCITVGIVGALTAFAFYTKKRIQYLFRFDLRCLLLFDYFRTRCHFYKQWYTLQFVSFFRSFSLWSLFDHRHSADFGRKIIQFDFGWLRGWSTFPLHWHNCFISENFNNFWEATKLRKKNDLMIINYENPKINY